MIGIYKIENLINGKKYIGQSIDIETRWAEHKRINERSLETIKQKYPLYLAFKKYGLENFSFEVLEICSKEKLDEREKYYIDYYNSYIDNENSMGYNLTRGGNGNQQVSQDQIQDMVQLWDKGLSTGEISTIVGRNKHVIIKYLKEYSNSYTIEESDRRGRILAGIAHRKIIYCFDWSGKFVKEYASENEIVLEYGKDERKTINSAINGRAATYKGNYYIKADENIKQILVQRMKKAKIRAIVQVDEDKKIIKYYHNITEAAKDIGQTSGTSIGSCCQGRTKTAYGKYWMYLYNYIDNYCKEELI